MRTKKNSGLLFGAHMSISGGYEKAILRGESIGCTAIQIFTKSNRQWAAKPISDHEAELFQKKFKESTVKSVIVHASYLINIGSSDQAINQNSIHALIEELGRCEKLGLSYLVLHPGSRQGTSEKECLIIIAESLNKVFAQQKSTVMVLLENTAGMGTSVGYTFEQLAEIYSQVTDKKRLGICVDTCHAFAAGYDFRTKSVYDKTWEEFDKILGLDLLKAMHINDSKKPCGSKVDRHAFIGKGVMGLEAFKLLFNDERFFDIPKTLETPIENGLPEEYIPDMQTIIDLLSDKNKKLVEHTPLNRYLQKS